MGGSGILRHCSRVSPSISRNSVCTHRDMQRRLRNGTATIANVCRHGKVRDKFACRTPGVHSMSYKSFTYHLRFFKILEVRQKKVAGWKKRFKKRRIKISSILFKEFDKKCGNERNEEYIQFLRYCIFRNRLHPQIARRETVIPSLHTNLTRQLNYSFIVLPMKR